MFKKITLEDKPIFDEAFQRLQYLGSECTFTNLFIWRECYDIRWAQEEGFLLVQVLRDNTSFLLPPFGGKVEDLPSIMQKLYNKLGAFEMRGIYRDIIEELEEALPGKFIYVLDRTNSDYIYRVYNLANLSGRKYHQKKNHANAFRKAYPNYQYVPMTKDIIKDCLEFSKKWYDERVEIEYDDSLHCEMLAIKEALNNFEALGFRGAVILVDGNIEAMTFGEKINNDTAVIHVEKANPNIRGLYAVINQEFCQREWSDLKYINREEDMGLEGLRRAKQSYQPKYLLDKFVTKVDFGE